MFKRIKRIIKKLITDLTTITVEKEKWYEIIHEEYGQLCQNSTVEKIILLQWLCYCIVLAKMVRKSSLFVKTRKGSSTTLIHESSCGTSLGSDGSSEFDGRKGSQSR